ncbi:MAG: triple tyrosine motif-containing protein [Bacteroidota bacterium]
MAIEQDRVGNIWLGGVNEALTMYDGKSFTPYSFNDSLGSVFGLYNDDLDNLWVRTRGFVHKVTADTLVSFQLNEQYRSSIFFDKIVSVDDNTVLLNTADRGMFLISDSVNRVDSIRGKPVGLVSDLLRVENYVYAITFNQGVIEFNYGRNLTPTVYSYPQYLVEEEVYSATTLNDIIYIITSKGIYSLKIENSELLIEPFYPMKNDKYVRLISWKKSLVLFGYNSILILDDKKIEEELTSSEHFSGYQILDVKEDHAQNLWVGTSGGGIYTYTGSFHRFTDGQGIEGEVVFTIQSTERDSYFIGTNKGLNKVSSDQRQKSELIWDKEYVRTSTVDSKGNHWFATNTMIILPDNEGKNIREIKMDTTDFLFPYSMTAHHKDGVWICTYQGLFRVYEEGNYSLYKTENGLRSDSINHVFQWANNEWLISTSKGLNIFKNGKIGPFNEIPELSISPIDYVYRDQNYIWFIVSGQGLARYSPETKKILFVTEEDGLPTRSCKSIVTDDYGNPWVGTSKGLAALKTTSDTTYNISKFDIHDGFKGYRCIQYAILKEDDGIWFGTFKGAYKVLTNNLNQIPLRVPLYISRIELFNGKEELWEHSNYANSWFNVPINLKLPYDKNHLTFNFTGISFSGMNDLSYSYFLKGLDNTWSPKQTIDKVTYTNIPPGTYTFEVKAFSNKNESISDKVSFSFKINSPFWETWWFMVTTILIFGVCLFSIHRYYVKKKVVDQLKIEELKKKEADLARKQLAMDFHDELGNKLASINTFTGLLKDHISPDKEYRFMLNTLSESVNSLMVGTKEFIWSLNPKHDNLFDILAYLKDFGENLYRETTITFFVEKDLDEYLKDHSLPIGWARHVVLIFKEAMTNALKHSNASRIELSFHTKENFLMISLFDNGIGIDDNNNRSSGLSNMKLRAEKLKGDLEILRLNDNGGTKICLSLNISEDKFRLLKVS